METSVYDMIRLNNITFTNVKAQAYMINILNGGGNKISII